ncbi:uncharacterized protein LOC113641995 [Tachysurus fulvidraco]|uniref:uncharacterized protein LOC113641995 n=1 Tax=Tachysurus fulvidraco TaxID=1234273 RepID=UPI001FEF997E|nr:uncharacterized protein LOC113641995 [Tachysurus fulvidraco]
MCFSVQAQRTQEAACPGVVYSGAREPWTLCAAAAEDASWARLTSPPPAPPDFKISTRNHTPPPFVRRNRPPRPCYCKGKARTHCLPGARVLDLTAQVPGILSKHTGAVFLHAGTNDTSLRQSEILKMDLNTVVETDHSTLPTARIIVSGPLPMYQQGIEMLSRLFALNEWLQSWRHAQNLLFIDNWNVFWERPWLFDADGLHPSRVGAEILSDHNYRVLHTF